MQKEILLSNDNIPLKINLLEINDIYTNWHKELKIIYVLKGSLFIDINESKIDLVENQFILINSYDFSFIRPNFSENSIFLEILVDSSFINRVYPNFSYINFKCLSTNTNISDEKYNIIRKKLSQIIDLVLKNETHKNILILNTVLDLSLFLVNNFKVEEISSEKDISNKNRLIKILNYLEKNYDNDNLTIYEISEYMELSSQYILKLFRKNFGIGLIDYLNSLRVKKSLNDLLYTDKNIIEISIDNGFNNNKTYHRLFKKEYGITPGIYRKENLKKFLKIETNNFFMNKNDIKIVVDEDFQSLDIEARNETILLEVDFNKRTKNKFNNCWRKFMSLGKASEGLNGDIQYQIKEIKAELNPEYIRFTGVFNDEMHIYNEDIDGNVYYNFAYIDKLIDFLIHEKLKPFINIGFMPKKLASKEQYVFSSGINISYPKDINIWKNLVSHFVRHLIEKYGEKEVGTWYFEIWNNPDLKKIYWYESDEKFFLFFQETFNTIKSVSKNLKVGGPGCMSNNNSSWIENFMIFTKDMKLDFFSYNSYIKLMNNRLNNSKLESSSSEEQPLFDKNIKKISSNAKKNYNKKIEIILSEWNLDPIPRDFLNDTCYTSTFILETVLNNFDGVNGMIYWTFTENKVGPNIFYGGLGLFTTNNLKKASYNAFSLLNKLGADIVSKGKNHFITVKEEGIQVLLYTHENLDKSQKSKDFQLNLNNFISGRYLITKHYLNTQSGSIYDAWIEMGCPKRITEDIYQLLKSKEKMNIKVEEKVIHDILIIKETLDSNGIVFLDIKKIHD